MTVREVCRQFKTSLNVVCFFLSHTSPLELDTDTKEVFSRKSYKITPLEIVVQRIGSWSLCDLLTSLASSSDETGTSNNECKAARNAICASGSLLPETPLNPSDSSARIDGIVRTATGNTRLGDDSSGLRLRCSCSGGSDAKGERYAWEDRYADTKNGFRGAKLTTPNCRFNNY